MWLFISHQAEHRPLQLPPTPTIWHPPKLFCSPVSSLKPSPTWILSIFLSADTWQYSLCSKAGAYGARLNCFPLGCPPHSPHSPGLGHLRSQSSRLEGWACGHGLAAPWLPVGGVASTPLGTSMMIRPGFIIVRNVKLEGILETI